MDYALQLNVILYDQKQTRRVWYLHPSKYLVEHVGFTQLKIDEKISTEAMSYMYYI
jgi:hypothetical protein